MRRKILVLLTTLVLCLAAYTGGASAFYTPADLTIPDSAQPIVYGESGTGRDLMAYRFGNGENVMVVGFAIHGFEDNWSHDGEALVYTAGQLMKQLDENLSLVEDYGWSIYVLPCMNPDGLMEGYSMNGPGRCTTTYLNKSGVLVSGGLDMNRSFPTKWRAFTNSRNFNGATSLASKESQALAQFVQDVKGSATNICIDTHGWMSQIITSNGMNSTLFRTFKSAFPNNTWANCNNGAGYFTAYTAQLGYASCLFEFPDGLYSMAAFRNSGYSDKYCGCILNLAKAYGTYDSHLSSCAIKNFTDVDRAAWYHIYLDYAVEKGIFKGTTTDAANPTFEPNAEMTRAMLVTTLWRVAGSPEVELPPETVTEETEEPAESEESDAQETTLKRFPDVPEDVWYTTAVYWAQQNAIVTGYPEGDFKPDDYVSRQDMALILYRFAKWRGDDVSAAADLSAYTDSAQVGQYAYTAVSWANAKQIVTGVTTTTLEPVGTATRAQVATILMRYLEGNSVTNRTVSAPVPAVMEPIYYDDGEDLGGN